MNVAVSLHCLINCMLINMFGRMKVGSVCFQSNRFSMFHLETQRPMLVIVWCDCENFDRIFCKRFYEMHPGKWVEIGISLFVILKSDGCLPRRKSSASFLNASAKEFSTENSRKQYQCIHSTNGAHSHLTRSSNQNYMQLCQFCFGLSVRFRSRCEI